MDKKLLHLQIEHLFDNIKFRYSLIKKYETTVSALDIDGIKDKIRELYDQIIQLELSLQEEDVKKPIEQTKPVQVVEEKKKPVEVKEEKPPIVISKEIEKIPEVKKEIKQEEKPPVTIEKKEPITKKPVFEQKPIVADQFVASDDKTVAAKIKMNPINDLKKAIGINDKFLFIKELFSNNLQDYTRAIDELNRLMVFEDVQEYFQKLSEEHKWDADSEHALRLQEIVERKFL